MPHPAGPAVRFDDLIGPRPPGRHSAGYAPVTQRVLRALRAPGRRRAAQPVAAPSAVQRPVSVEPTTVPLAVLLAQVLRSSAPDGAQ